MANTSQPMGLVPVRHYFGGVIRPNEYTIADAYATALYMGDPVRCTGTGTDAGIGTAGSSAANTGVFAGCEYVDANGDTKFSEYWPASTSTKNAVGAKAFVWDDPFILYRVQFDATGLVAADIRQLADLHSGVGSAVTGLSGWYASYAAGSENQLKIMKLDTEYVYPNGVANAYGAYAMALVLFGKHELIATAPTEI